MFVAIIKTRNSFVSIDRDTSTRLTYLLFAAESSIWRAVTDIKTSKTRTFIGNYHV